jgi:hypothetical protein
MVMMYSEGEHRRSEMKVTGIVRKLKRYYSRCYFCKSLEKMKHFKGKSICEKCISEL